jgi:hypothetical protein
MSTSDRADAAVQPATIVVPPARTRAVSLGVVLALVFCSLTVGFAIGRASMPPSTAGVTFPGGGPGGGGFPAPGGGFPGAPGGQGPSAP